MTAHKVIRGGRGGQAGPRRPGLVAAAAAVLLLVTGLSAGVAAAAPASAHPVTGTGLRAACPAAPRGHERCYALFARQSGVNAAIAAGLTGQAATPQGWGAKAIEAELNLGILLLREKQGAEEAEAPGEFIHGSDGTNSAAGDSGWRSRRRAAF